MDSTFYTKTYHDILHEKVLEANKKFSLWSESDKVLVGFSGGADSLALLVILKELLPRESLFALHVNHMLRGEDADADEEFCRRFCQENDIPFQSVKVDVASASRGVGTEEVARNMRYDALVRTAKELGCRKIALAHTASDNAETVIFNLTRGAGLSGLRGITPKRFATGEQNIEVIRPLILATREEIEGFAKERALPFRIDITNSDTAYTRNFIRHKIVPLLKEINPSLLSRISATSELIADDGRLLGSLAADFISKYNIKNSADISALSSLPPSLLRRVIAKMYACVGAGDLEAKHMIIIEDFIRKGENGSFLSLPDKVGALIENGGISFLCKDELAALTEKKSFSHPVPVGATRFGEGFATLLLPHGDERIASEKERLQNGASLVAFAKIDSASARSLTVRNHENGEKYVFGNMTRTLKKLLSGESKKAKNTRPVFCDKSGIVWLPPHRTRDDIFSLAVADSEYYTLLYFEY